MTMWMDAHRSSAGPAGLSKGPHQGRLHTTMATSLELCRAQGSLETYALIAADRMAVEIWTVRTNNTRWSTGLGVGDEDVLPDLDCRRSITTLNEDITS
jgi:hypothetical protein